MMNTVILVPQGAEYKAVCRGLRQNTGSIPRVLAIPVGMQPLTKYLQQWDKQQSPVSSSPTQNCHVELAGEQGAGRKGENLSPPLPAPCPEASHHTKFSWQTTRVLVMGLCGSLRQNYAVGDAVLYQSCTYQGRVQECDRPLMTQLSAALPKVSLVKGLTSDRVIWSATKKSSLAATSNCDVVDMESFAALQFFQAMGIEVAVLRVVSDDSLHDIPDLSAAISTDGSLQALPLAWGLISQPIAATRLIRGSLQGLKVLEKVTQALLDSNLINT
ncbi:phosphorylase [Nostoc piscinale CENA21]|uniref:Phosphorylase n=1 Tax=Nostoc piscinale CENA21 TaxID=224013 RepID=A0A0M5MI47_9NOSO|nr:phosphorylase [Nostoc piscinale]ALF56018.1 phosphorylase [Nostoc piscinale CENA21]